LTTKKREGKNEQVKNNGSSLGSIEMEMETSILTNEKIKKKLFLQNHNRNNIPILMLKVS
ncbi:hypothetical protein, partial [Sphingobacterium mizutaii]|uniref:hypothetical protein n=1 Tax=Sphingobacterium mizutaii TaxID=1010 RepID=UPI00289CA382